MAMNITFHLGQVAFAHPYHDQGATVNMVAGVAGFALSSFAPPGTKWITRHGLLAMPWCVSLLQRPQSEIMCVVCAQHSSFEQQMRDA